MNTQQKKHQENVTKKILELMQKDNLSWVRPWASCDVPAALPINAISRKTYRGANVVSLWATACLNGYTSNAWATFKQINSLGGHVLKGEKATEVFLFKPLVDAEKDEQAEGEEKRGGRLVFRTFHVFNMCQTSLAADWSQTEPKEAGEAIADAETFIAGIKHDVRMGGNSASYHPIGDYIKMPNREQFKQVESFYSTYLHELTHWTGHPSREAREGITKFECGGPSKEDYAFEELVAEIGSAFACAHLGIEGQEHQAAAYLQHWVQLLKNDNTAFFRAASLASKAFERLKAEAEKVATVAA